MLHKVAWNKNCLGISARHIAKGQVLEAGRPCFRAERFQLLALQTTRGSEIGQQLCQPKQLSNTLKIQTNTHLPIHGFASLRPVSAVDELQRRDMRARGGNFAVEGLRRGRCVDEANRGQLLKHGARFHHNSRFHRVAVAGGLDDLKSEDTMKVVTGRGLLKLRNNLSDHCRHRLIQRHLFR